MPQIISNSKVQKQAHFCRTVVRDFYQERSLPINYLDLVLLGNWAVESMASREEQEYFRITGHPALFQPCFTAEAVSRACQTAKHTAPPAKQRGNPVNGILRAVGVRLQLLKHFSGSVTASVSVRRCTQPAQELRLGAGNGGLATGTRQLVAKPPRSFYDLPNKAFRAAQGAKWKGTWKLLWKSSFPMQSTAALAILKQICSDKNHRCLCSTKAQPTWFASWGPRTDFLQDRRALRVNM